MATSGLVIGKFLPFHDGHAHLMETASRAVDELVVIVCSAAWHEIPVELRVEWIAESFPDARVVVIDQEQRGLGEGGTEAWAAATLDVLGRRPDVVYTSEDYGPAYAGLMGAEHVMVDRERAVVPVSGTEVRERPLAHLDLLSPQVRAHYVLRVCVIGAESTGKTTLARDLAGHYGVTFVPEFGRYYCEAMPVPTRYRWTTEDFRTIARVQSRFEDDAARWVGPVLVCDTNAFVTSVFHEAYLGRRDPCLEAEAAARRYDLFLLCGEETPFVQDGTGLRHEGTRRARMQDGTCATWRRAVTASRGSRGRDRSASRRRSPRLIRCSPRQAPSRSPAGRSASGDGDRHHGAAWVDRQELGARRARVPGAQTAVRSRQVEPAAGRGPGHRAVGREAAAGDRRPLARSQIDDRRVGAAAVRDGQRQEAPVGGEGAAGGGLGAHVTG
jgi:HTH-type transcriptional repressor of NAD biosynthesis genes